MSTILQMLTPKLRRPRSRVFVRGAVCWLIAAPLVAMGQLPHVRPPLEPSDTSSPRATLNSFISACNTLDELVQQGAVAEENHPDVLPVKERILDCLDLSDLPRDLRGLAGIDAALFLKEVLDRVALPPEDEIPLGIDADANPEQPLLTWNIPGTRLKITRVEQGPQQHEYLFSPETVRRAAEFFQIARLLPYRTDGPRVSPGLNDAYVAATRKQPTLSSDTSSPRSTLTRFLDSADELFEAIQQVRHIDRQNLEHQPLVDRIISCLDISQLPGYTREYFDAEAAVCLKEVLDRVPLPPPEEIPGSESVEGSAGVEPLARWQVPGTQITIARMQDGPRRGEFLFSAETVAQAPELYRRAQSRPYRTEGRPVTAGFYDWWLSSPGHPIVAQWLDSRPNWLRQRVLWAAVWQWIGLVVAIPVALAIMFLVSRFGRWREGDVQENSLLRYWLTLAYPLVVMLIPLGFKRFAWDYLTLRGNAFYVTAFCADVVFLLAGAGLVVGISSRIGETIAALRQSPHGGLDDNLIRIICRVLGLAAAAVVLLEGGRFLGFPVTTLIASAGIGGLALALSAQGFIKGLFGTVVILLDKPFRVGDRILACGQDGIVDEIGLRSTKLRAFLTDHVVSIPNDRIADAEIENIGTRKHIRRMTDLHIPLDTPCHKVEKAVAIIRNALQDHKGLDPDFPPQVYFNEFNPDSFNIRIVYWYSPPELWDYYAFCEQLNLEIFQAFEEQGIQFSLPFRHTYWKHDGQQGPLDVSVVDERVPATTSRPDAQSPPGKIGSTTSPFSAEELPTAR